MRSLRKEVAALALRVQTRNVPEAAGVAPTSTQVGLAPLSSEGQPPEAAAAANHTESRGI